MSDNYASWNQDLMYSSEIATEFVQINIENYSSPVRAQRFRELRSSSMGSPMNLTPNMSRSPLQTLIETPEGVLYSPCYPRNSDTST